MLDVEKSPTLEFAETIEVSGTNKSLTLELKGQDQMHRPRGPDVG